MFNNKSNTTTTIQSKSKDKATMDTRLTRPSHTAGFRRTWETANMEWLHLITAGILLLR
ncbi:hypothetical protein DPMN_066343 [Dreissena polymorpha]|uniref:Uncharacterized protein n=1 Tax=Dreissena polymorpha TaxID=45954 RepID=A0A9D4BSU5_DREPO|nr:hypothetical protein DPMN_066343 [Dreissena polymorpha]